jgi:hypothetical protein
VIAYRNDKLEATELDDVWTVRLANLEARARYLDLALAELLGDAPEAHRAAARVLSELADVVEQQEANLSHAAPLPRRRQRRARRRELPRKTVPPGLRILAFAVIASTAFVLTTWLSTLR